MLRKARFGDCELYILENDCLRAAVTDLGATLVSLRAFGRETVLGYDSPEQYLAGKAYLGACIGRFGNRIGGAVFPLNGETVRLTPNEGPNQLHGGPCAFDKRRWTGEISGESLRLRLISPHGDNGFPGELRAAVTYSLRGASLRIDFEAESDRDTVYAPTNHSYFDLSGRGDCRKAELWLGADRVVEPGEGLIPTGRLLPAEGDFDFSRPRIIERDYDHAFVLSGEHACSLRDGGLRMDLFTDFPALQVYTGAFLHAPHRPHQGVALEPEFFPDSPNHPDFPNTTLHPGERFQRWAEYRFSQT